LAQRGAWAYVARGRVVAPELVEQRQDVVEIGLDRAPQQQSSSRNRSGVSLLS
jgi:hypothetical protein